jgi:3-hydroxyisobutyrate dehydrogenase
MTTVAVLGTGMMGEPIARNLQRAGFDVRAWNRTRAKAEPLAADGATVCDSAAEAARGADVVLTMLTDAAATAETVEEVAFDDGAIWIQMATVGLDGTERLAGLAQERGVAFVDSPVLGTHTPAEKRKLVVLASGPEDALDRCWPLFEAISSKVERLGPAPNGSKLKLVVNLWLLAITEGGAEALAFADGLGLDPHVFLDAIAGSQTDCVYVHMKADAMLAGTFEPSFKLSLAAKDAGLAVEAAERAGVEMRVGHAVHEAFDRAVELGHGDEDIAAVYFATKR